MNDLFIVSQIRQGDLKVFDVLYPKYRDEFCQWLKKSYQLDEESCKDIYQQSIVILFENVRDEKLVKLTSSLKTYIFSIGRNKAREHMSYVKKHVLNQDYKFDSIDSIELGDNIEELQLSTIETCLSELKNPCKGIIIDFYYHKKSMDVIAKRFGYKNTDSAKNQKSKCMRKLRTLVRDKMKVA